MLKPHPRRVANQRENYHWRLADYLAKKYDIVCIEDLNLNGMKKLWGRKVSDLAFHAFVQRLDHTLTKHGKRLVKINRYEPSSKRCSCCGHVVKELDLKTRQWQCPSCEAILDRDYNAAVNIYQVGTSTCNGVSVKPCERYEMSMLESHVL